MGEELPVKFEPRFREVPAAWNEITRRIIGCAIEVHRHLGPGLLERLYEDAMVYELGAEGLALKRQEPVRVRYKSIQLSEQRLDLVVENLVVLELKSVDSVPDAHLATLMSYLRSGDYPLGLLINFGSLQLTKGIFRRIYNGSSRFASVQTDPPLRSSTTSAISAF